MEFSWKRLLWNLALPLGVGALSSLLVAGSMEQYQQLQQPPLSPPGSIFPIVWTVLFLLMGVSTYLIGSKGDSLEWAKAWRVYGLQLFVNFLWPLFFFRLQWYLFSFLWLLLLILLVIVMIVRFRRLVSLAGWLQIPYLAWLMFAGYLNLGIYFLNS